MWVWVDSLLSLMCNLKLCRHFFMFLRCIFISQVMKKLVCKIWKLCFSSKSTITLKQHVAYAWNLVRIMSKYLLRNPPNLCYDPSSDGYDIEVSMVGYFICGHPVYICYRYIKGMIYYFNSQFKWILLKFSKIFAHGILTHFNVMGGITFITVCDPIFFRQNVVCKYRIYFKNK